MKYSYSKDFRLKSNRQYQYVLERSKGVRGKYITLHAHHNPSHPYTKIGIVASKKYGKAVDRNRFKRIVREAFRKIKSSFPPGMQMVIRPRKYATVAKMHDVLDELLKLSKEVAREESKEQGYCSKQGPQN